MKPMTAKVDGDVTAIDKHVFDRPHFEERDDNE